MRAPVLHRGDRRRYRDQVHDEPSHVHSYSDLSPVATLITDLTESVDLRSAIGRFVLNVRKCRESSSAAGSSAWRWRACCWGRRHGVAVCEKERTWGRASERPQQRGNSLRAVYRPGGLKARLCAAGQRRWRRPLGSVTCPSRWVASSPAVHDGMLPGLKELACRGVANGHRCVGWTPCRFGTVPAPAGYGLWWWVCTVRYWMIS
jgi:hypothetical protein